MPSQPQPKAMAPIRAEHKSRFTRKLRIASDEEHPVRQHEADQGGGPVHERGADQGRSSARESIHGAASIYRRSHYRQVTYRLIAQPLPTARFGAFFQLFDEPVPIRDVHCQSYLK